jgi:FkbM family methyltransferase
VNFHNILKRGYNFIGRKIFPEDNLLFFENTMEGGLYRSFQMRRISPGTIIDVGAAEGKWSLLAKKYWKESNFVLFEPLEERKSVLEDMCNLNPGFYFVNKGAGEKKGFTDFYVTADLDGSGTADNNSNTIHRTINLTSIDAEIRALNLAGPFVVKLDTHGYEVPILKGSEQVLQNTQLLIIECYGFRLSDNSLLFWEMCEYINSKGFRLIDIVDISLRIKDGSFWQCDAFFIPADSKIFLKNTYS